MNEDGLAAPDRTNEALHRAVEIEHQTWIVQLGDPRLEPPRALNPYRDLLRRVGVEMTDTSLSQAGP